MSPRQVAARLVAVGAVLVAILAVRSRRDRRGPEAVPHPGEGVVSAIDLDALTRDELYERARDLELPGRSKMNKAELQAALTRLGAHRER